ncbi:MAG: insulinase family protein [Lacibacter sp.]
MTNTKKIVAFLLVFICSIGSYAQQFQLNDPIAKDPNVKTGKLANGLTYYIRKNAKPAKKVELRLVVNAGSVLENENQLGLAHFMEHMSFNGSKNFPKNELVNFLQKSGIKFGADLNAYTSFDETVYILPVPLEDPAMFDKGMTVLEDWAFNNLFDKTEIEKERGVVLEESRLSKGSSERMSRQYFPKLFNGSKYAARLPIGTDVVLKTFKPETLKSFYKTWYRPNLMAVIIVGDIDPAEAEKSIQKHFGNYQNPKVTTPRPSIIPIKTRTTSEAMVVTDDEATNTIIQIFNFVKPAPKVKTWADFRTSLINNLLSSLINQRLNELTQKEKPPFIFGNTSYSPFVRGYTSFTSVALVADSNVNTAINALIAETNRAKKFGFLQSEIDRVKASLLTSAEKAFKEADKSESGNIIRQYINNFLSGTPIPGAENNYNFVKQILPAITPEEINQAAAKMPELNTSFTLLLAPSTIKNKLPDNSQLQKNVIAAATRPVEPYVEKTVATKLIEKEPAPGTVTATTQNEKLGTTNYTLSNGITIIIKPTTYKNDEIMMDAWRLGGFQKYAIADKNNAQYAAQIVQEMGVKNMTPTDINKFKAGKTFNVSTYINNNEEGVEGTSSVKDFETFLQMVYLYFTQPRKDPALFRSFVSKQKGYLEYMSKDPTTSYMDTVQKIIYNNNPWAEGIPEAKTFDELNLDRSFAIYNEVFGNAYGLNFTFVGNIDPVTAKPLLEKYLGSLPSVKKENSCKDVGLRLLPGKTDVAIKRGKDKQAMINLFFEGPAEYNRTSRIQFRALIEVINIKVIEKLREDMSGMYGGGLNGDLVKRPYEHYSITAEIPCGPENVDKLYAALIDIIKNIQQNGAEQKDLDKVLETWKKQYHTSLQNNSYYLSAFSNAFINGDNPENILDYEQFISTLTTKDIQNAAVKYLTLDKMVKAVLYPTSSPVKEEVKKSN